MAILGTILMVVCGLGSVACWVIVLIKMFKTEEPLHGIIAIFCGIYAFIWGWMKASTHDLKKIMLIWTGCFGLSGLSWVLVGAGAMAGNF